MHRATARFWELLDALPPHIQALVHKNFELLKTNPRHPSLYFKKIGKLWAARDGINYRVLAVEDGNDYIWVWIGPHEEYDRLVK